jgi:hypothetical protein
MEPRRPRLEWSARRLGMGAVPGRSTQSLEVMEPSPLQRLEDMGFRRCGEWRAESECVKCALVDHASAPNVLYAFVSDGAVLYIGKTVRSLKQRMYNYQNPGPSQSTSIRGNKLIKELVALGKSVEVYALPDNGLLRYGGFHVNLAAGLEDALISDLKPKWNKAGI